MRGLESSVDQTPKKGDKSDRTARARARTRAFKRDDRANPSPIPLESCPWCGTKFTRNSFTLEPNEDYPIDLRIVCANRRCEFSGDNRLPVLGVDEPIYRRLPAFVIATVDKFASLPWVGETGKLFGKADRADKEGFYGPCDALSVGHKMPQALPPPDLIIQDELHLISGPLGTMVGLYETAIDALCRRSAGEKVIRPKVVSSHSEPDAGGKLERTQFDEGYAALCAANSGRWEEQNGRFAPNLLQIPWCGDPRSVAAELGPLKDTQAISHR